MVSGRGLKWFETAKVKWIGAVWGLIHCGLVGEVGGKD
jgi:hypothetical protein